MYRNSFFCDYRNIISLTQLTLLFCVSLGVEKESAVCEELLLICTLPFIVASGIIAEPFEV